MDEENENPEGQDGKEPEDEGDENQQDDENQEVNEDDKPEDNDGNVEVKDNPEGKDGEETEGKDAEEQGGKETDKVEEEKPEETVKDKPEETVKEKTEEAVKDKTEKTANVEGAVEGETKDESIEKEHVVELAAEESEEEFIVHPFAMQSPDGTISPNIFEFIHSYGFDCQRPYNLCALDEETVAWASGSYVTFYNVITKQTTFRRSSTGGSIGALAKNPDPTLSHVAIAEGGLPWAEPVILIFEWPSMEMLFVLRKGTERSYSKLDYSPNGGLLASVGGSPDYNLTVWKWKQHRILLQASAFTFTVDNVRFSPYIPEQLTTSGASHVKFWKMSQTFTGLKLKGELGRFGKTEICDILGVYPMPDEKVLSGCTWGNILVWEGGLVKLEVRRKGKNPCHDGPITYFLRNDETAEVTTVGMDGFVKSWYWETVDEAVVGGQEGGNFVELNNVTEFSVPGAQLVNITHKKDSFWFGQDARGSVWTIDFDIDSPNWAEPQRETMWHGGSIVGLEVLRGSREMLVSLGSDGTLGLSEIPTGPMKCLTASIGKAECLLYFPKKLDSTGRILLIGNLDGNIKLLALMPEHLDDKTEIVTDDSCINVLQILKPHTAAITTMSLNNECDTLVTASMDSTLFVYRVAPGEIIPQLIPLCYIDTPKIINHINWSLSNRLRMFMCANDGLLLEAELPYFSEPPSPDTITYRQDFAFLHLQYFKEYSLRYTLPDEDEGIMSIDSGSDEEEEKPKKEEDDEEENKKEEPPEPELIIYREKSSRPLLFSAWDPWNEEVLWIIPEGFGCILNYKPRSNLPFTFTPLPEDSWEVNITSIKYLKEQDIVMLGKSDGEMFMFHEPTTDIETFNRNYRKREKKAIKDKLREKPELILRADIVDYLRLAMHDCTSGNITQMVFSNSEKYFFTAGSDGNIFSYSFEFTPEVKEGLSFDLLQEETLPELVELPDEEAVLSHEELANEKERQRLLHAANLHKQRVRNQLAGLTLEFKQILKRNMALPPRQQVDLSMDSRIMEEEDKGLAEQMALTRRKLAFPLAVSSLRLHKMMHRNVDSLDVFPFQLNSMLIPDFNVKIIRQNNLPPKFFDDIEIVKNRLDEAIRKAQMSQEKDNLGLKEKSEESDYGPDAPLLYWVPPEPPPPRALVTALRRYLERINRHHLQEKEWEAHLEKHSFEHVEREGAAALEYEEANIGEYHLKSRPGAMLPTSKGAITLHTTHLRLFINRQEIFEIQHAFNATLLQLRQEKAELVTKFTELDKRLQTIAQFVPPSMCQPSPFNPLPSIDNELEFPELNLKLFRPKHVRISKDFGRLRKTTVVEIPVQTIVNVSHEDPSNAFWETNSATFFKTKGTPVEEEYKKRHLRDLLVEQEKIIKFMRSKMKDWEKRLKEAGRARERVLIEAQYLKINQLQLTQEFIVLDSMQFKEDTLMDLVRGHQKDCKMALDQVKDLQKSIEDMNKDIAAGLDQIKVLEQQQKRIALEVPKFSKFLKRVFKKKRKPPKTDSDDEESESESESSEEESESSDSEGELDIEKLRMDSSECPPGCDPTVFEETVELREIRYQVENNIKDNERNIESSKRTVSQKNKEIKILTLILEESQGKLQDLLDIKQKLLNEIECTIVVPLDHCAIEGLQGVMNGEHACENSGALLFPAPYIAKLKARVLELLREEQEQRRRYFLNLNHVRRMKVDCSFMENKIAQLRTKYQEMLTNKLAIGKSKKGITDPNLLKKAAVILDAVLIQMTQSFKVAVSSGFTFDMNEQIEEWKEKREKLEQEYCSSLQEHTEKLKLAGTLQAEILTKSPNAPLLEMPGGRTEEEYKQDIVRLKRLKKEQQQQIDSLKEEIYNLRVKHPCADAGTRAPTLPGDTGPPSEIVTPPCQPSKIRTIAASLVRCLAESGLNLLQDLAYGKCLLEDISSLLPAIASGETGVEDATAKILRNVFQNVKNEEQILKMEQCKKSVTELLSQFIQENVLLDEIRHVTSVATQLRSTVPSPGGHDRSTTDILKDAVIGLLEAGVNANYPSVIDAIVTNLISQYPGLKVKNINRDILLVDIMKQGVVYRKNQVEDIIHAIIECISAQLDSDETKDMESVELEAHRALSLTAIVKQSQSCLREKPKCMPKATRSAPSEAYARKPHTAGSSVSFGPTVKQAFKCPDMHKKDGPSSTKSSSECD